MAADKSSVLTFPLPAFAGGGNCSIGCKPSSITGHVDFVVTSHLINRSFSIPLEDAKGFAKAIEAAHDKMAELN